jgi:hypothetical protein
LFKTIPHPQAHLYIQMPTSIYQQNLWFELIIAASGNKLYCHLLNVSKKESPMGGMSKYCIGNGGFARA